jgi:hypothetical protein
MSGKDWTAQSNRKMETNMEKPIVAPCQWVNVSGVNSVVCQVFKETPPDMEVVFMDKGKAVNKRATWDSNRWIFAGGDYGGYADNYTRLAEYVAILRSGRQYHLGQ